MATEAPPSGSLVRWVLPIGLFVVIVGVIAWVSQNLPKGVVQTSGPEPIIDPEKPAHLHFLRTLAIWDENDPNYLKECERDVLGHYDFPFLNLSETPVMLGLVETKCDCTKIEVVALGKDGVAAFKELSSKSEVPVDPSWNWAVLDAKDKTGVEVPAGGGGVLRVVWDGRKGTGQKLKLTTQLWMHPAGKSSDRSFQVVDVPIVMSEPIRYSPDRLSLGFIGAGGEIRGELLAWSPTRDNFELKTDPKKHDPLFEVAIDKLDAKAAADLQDRFFIQSVVQLDKKDADARLANLRETAKATRYRSAFRVRVTLREQKDNKQLELGPFSREIPFASDVVPIDHKPIVAAFVRGEVEVGNTEDIGKITLNFHAREGLRKIVPLWSEAGNELVLDDFSPRVLNPKLTKNQKESTAARNKWKLEISIPPGAWSGPFLEDSVIYLRTSSTPPRRIRIPIVGNAGQG